MKFPIKFPFLRLSKMNPARRFITQQLKQLSGLFKVVKRKGLSKRKLLNYLPVRHYFPFLCILSLLLGGILFVLSGLRTGSIPPKTMYCFEENNERNCRRRHLQGKLIKNKEIEEVTVTRCFCKNLHLSQVKIYNSDFRENNFNQSFFNNVSFVKTDLFKSFFYGAVLENVVFEDSDLRGAVFNFTTLRNVYFKNIDLSSTLFIGARFENVQYDKNTRLFSTITEAQKKRLVLKNNL